MINDGNIFHYAVDYREVAKLIECEKSTLAEAVKNAVEKELQSLSPSTCLSFELRRYSSLYKTVAPEASRTYAKVLVAYMQGNKYDGYTVESKVTPLVLRVVEKVIVNFYSSKAIQEKVSAGITQEIKDSKIIRTIVEKSLIENRDWLVHELKILLSEQASMSIAGEAINATAENMADFLSSSTGEQLVSTMGQAMSTGLGVLLAKQIAIVVAKAMASTVFKSVIFAAIKKVGIAIIIKTAVGKVLLSLLALVGISGIPVAWIILPLIGAMLYHDYKNFPQKLARKVPNEVSAGILRDFKNINNGILKEMVALITDELFRYLTDPSNKQS